MKADRFSLCALGGVIFVVAMVAMAAEQAMEKLLGIVSIEAQGTNLVLIGTVPAGLQKVTLEVRPSLDAPWTEAAETNAPTDGGPVTFTIPKFDQMGFMRLKGEQSSAAPPPTAETTTPAPVTSSELHYATLNPLGNDVSNTNPSATNEAVLHFKGMIDGSDKITVRREGAFWEHTQWSWPGEVEVNGLQWKPQEENYLSAAGTNQLLPDGYSFDNAELEIVKGRDTVALEQTDHGVIIYVDDTLPGADLYEFNVRFHRAPAASAERAMGAPAALRIMAQIDGSDTLIITTNAATWKHHFWSPPGQVTLNDVVWNPAQQNSLTNEGTNAFLPASINLSTAKIVGRKGRDLVTMQAQPGALIINFADNPGGADTYELDLAFGE
jgi:hypothetical protein